MRLGEALGAVVDEREVVPALLQLPDVVLHAQVLVQLLVLELLADDVVRQLLLLQPQLHPLHQVVLVAREPEQLPQLLLPLPHVEHQVQRVLRQRVHPLRIDPASSLLEDEVPALVRLRPQQLQALLELPLVLATLVELFRHPVRHFHHLAFLARLLHYIL